MIFLPTKKTPLTAAETDQIIDLMKFLKPLRNLIIYKEGDVTKIWSYDTLKDSTKNLTGISDVEVLFSNSDDDWRGYKLKISAYEQHPRLRYENGEFVGLEKIFFDVVSEKLNARTKITKVMAKTYEERARFVTAVKKGEIDVFLNTFNPSGLKSVDKFVKPVNTYNTVGFCALIPSVKNSTQRKNVLTPMDGYTIAILLTAISICAIMWKLFMIIHPTRRSFDSPGYFIFGIVASFFSQTIPYRRNRLILNMIISMFALTFLVFANVYKSLLFTTATEFRENGEISTIDEMLSKYRNYYSDKIFNLTINETGLYHNMSIKTLEYHELATFDLDKLSKKEVVLIIKCDVAESLVKEQVSTIHDCFYILPEKFFTTFEKFVTGRYSPFNAKLNELSLKVFESGIRQFWLTFLGRQYDKNSAMNIFENEDSLLKLDDFFGVFVIYGICLAISSIVFFLEILWRFTQSVIDRTWSMLTRSKRQLPAPTRRRVYQPRTRVEVEPFGWEDL